ncbi:MAG: hypothetical protein K1W34_10225 [Lachnospiraceae bacterium]
MTNRRFGADISLSKQSGALFAEEKSTAYGDLGMKAFLNPLAAVGS